MKESVLVKYFDGEITAIKLHESLREIRGVSALRKGHNFDCDLNSFYEIGINSLTRICGDFLEGHIDGADIEAISFFLMGSDHFEWDSNTNEGAVVAQVIDDWNFPAVAYPINRRNIKMVARGLGEGVYDTRHLNANQR